MKLIIFIIVLNIIYTNGLDSIEKQKLIRVLRGIPQFSNFFGPPNNNFFGSQNIRPTQNLMTFPMPQQKSYMLPQQPMFYSQPQQPSMNFFPPPQQVQQRQFQAHQPQGFNKPAFQLEEGEIFGECGILKPKVRKYVSGGEDTEHSLWPWFAQLIIGGNNRSDSETYCGGTLIHNEYVLTAAHCYDDLLPQNRIKNSMVVFKGLDLPIVHRPRHGKKPDNILRVKVKNVHIHHNYIPAMSEYEARLKHTIPGPLNDIALIQLKHESKDILNKLMPACLPKEKYQVEYNTECKIMGHGFMSASGEENFIMPQKLQMADVKISNNHDCRSTVESLSIKSKINHDTHCILGPIHPCVGDSGGPLLCAGDSDDVINGERKLSDDDNDDNDDEDDAFVSKKRWYLTGVTSFAVSTDEEDRCGQFKSAVFGKVSHFIDWIREIIINNKLY